MLPPFKVEEAITQIAREEWGRILAALVASFNNIQLAEDALQDAVEQALTAWQQQGLPNSPAAWLITTAKRKAIDKLRRTAKFNELQPELSYLYEIESVDDGHDTAEEELIPDKRLELIFTCCHPALEEKSRIALTLRTLGGLTTEEIANAFLDNPKTMAQRLTRAKNKISVAGIPFKLPEDTQLQQRLDTVLSVIYLIFNEGYSASRGDNVTRKELSNEAIRLARIVNALLPMQTEVSGILALMLLHDSRRTTRENKNGAMIPLEYQNRAGWNHRKIQEGKKILKAALQWQKPGPYQIQAAISALHADSPDWVSTDWKEISALYEVLYTLTPSPVVRINHCVAVSYAASVGEALSLLQTLKHEKNIQNYQPFFAVRGDFYIRLNKQAEAKKDLQRAIDLSQNKIHADFLQNKIEQL